MSNFNDKKRMGAILLSAIFNESLMLLVDVAKRPRETGNILLQGIKKRWLTTATAGGTSTLAVLSAIKPAIETNSPSPTSLESLSCSVAEGIQDTLSLACKIIPPEQISNPVYQKMFAVLFFAGVSYGLLNSVYKTGYQIRHGEKELNARIFPFSRPENL